MIRRKSVFYIPANNPRISAKIRWNNYYILDCHSLDYIYTTYLKKNGIWKKEHMTRKKILLQTLLKLALSLECYHKDRFLNLDPKTDSQAESESLWIEPRNLLNVNPKQTVLNNGCYTKRKTYQIKVNTI